VRSCRRIGLVASSLRQEERRRIVRREELHIVHPEERRTDQQEAERRIDQQEEAERRTHPERLVAEERRTDQQEAEHRNHPERLVAEERRIDRQEVPRQTHHQEADLREEGRHLARANPVLPLRVLVLEGPHPVNCRRLRCYPGSDWDRSLAGPHHRSADSLAEQAEPREVQVLPLRRDPREVLQRPFPQDLVLQNQPPASVAEVQPPWEAVEVQVKGLMVQAVEVQPEPLVAADSSASSP
jgi:hypothetical protein